MNRVFKFRAWDGQQFLPLTREVAFVDDSGALRTRREGIVFDQFTGLADKNGKEIYEGDIVILFVTEQYDEHDGPYAVQWGHFSDCCVEGETWILGDIWQPTLWYYANDPTDNRVEIIGNIYEHPELLKEEE